MVKLAETRTKKKYNLVPRGKALYEDETRFGTKMLEKMGWTKGKGLGARGEGLQDFVHVRYKNDAEGFGYEARDDQWTQHQESFDGLLKSLTENSTGNATEKCGINSDVENKSFGLGFSQNVENNNSNSLKAKISGQSLEERSKQSRARVHYKKFTKGKDLSQYSEKDLANIFGMKAFDGAAKPAESEFVQNNVKSEKEVETFQSSTLSVSDYFKQKMEALEMKRNGLITENEQLSSVENQEEEVKDTNEVQKENKKKKIKSEKETSEGVAENSKKAKKLKKEKKQAEPEVMQINQDEVEIENSSTAEELQESATIKPKTAKSENENPKEVAENSKKAKKLKKEKKQAKPEVMQINQDEVEIENSSTAEELKESATKKLKTTETHKRERTASITEEIFNIEAKKVKLEPEAKKKRCKKYITDFQLEDMLEFLQSSHIFTISSYAAERFRLTDFAGFKGANISEIRGYDVPTNVQLQVKTSSKDKERVIRLWTSKERKTTKNPYKQYTREVRAAREKNEKMPRLKTHKFAKRNAFKLVNI